MWSKNRVRPPAMLTVLATIVLAAVEAGTSDTAEAAAAEQARSILSQTGSERGICVLLGQQPAELAVALARQSELTVYVQLPTDDAVAGARARVDAAGMLGTRVYVEEGPWSHIHLADNLADFVVVTPAAISSAKAHRAELLRVVNPLGKVLLGVHEITKPYPAGADDWSHPYHGGDNNPQSRDRLARAPYLTQYLARPWYVPPPGVTVASAGRVFQAFGHIAYHRREWPWRNTLAAVNGYNGTLLWKRPLEPGFMIHRNTMIATPETLYVADGKSCKLLDTATGELRGEIVAPPSSTGASAAGSGDAAWKWMAIEDGVLYALVGEKEFHDPGHRLDWGRPGWPWKGMSPGYDLEEYPWGFGRTLFAVDPKTRRVFWVRKEESPIDGRAICISGGRIFYYSDQKFLACLDAKRGKPLWRSSDPKLLEAIGPNHRAQVWYRGMSTQGYMKCSDKAIYLAGPQRTRLVAVSTADGRMLWQFPDGNFQLVLRDEGLYAMGPTSRSPQGSPGSKLFDPLTGRILADLDCHRGNCARATGTIDSIFCRGDAHGGTLRLAVADNAVPHNHVQRIAPMRPPCHDGVIAAGGMLYWGSWICDCNLSLVGNIGLSPAGDFQFSAPAVESERLWPPIGGTRSRPTEWAADLEGPVEPLEVAPGDWPTYRADNRRSAAARVDVPRRIAEVWQHQLPATVDPAPPITAGGMVFLSGSDGMIRALDAAGGTLRWKGYTGGAIRFPPAVDRGRLLAGSGDGWVYAFEAATGRRLWRFRAAPSERKINLYGQLSSTWPVASGVLAASSAKVRPVVYAAAGIACYDGTHVYALDAATGRIRWQNNTSGNLAGNGKLTGVSVQGHLLLHDRRLYLAGGNAVSPAVYDVQDGRCLNTLKDEWAKAPRGRELFLVDGKVVAFDRLLYSPKEYRQGEFIPYQSSRYFARHFLQAHAGEVLVRASGGRIVRISAESSGQEKPKALWESAHFRYPVAMALGKNAVVVAGQVSSSGGSSTSPYAIAALAVEDGELIWTKSLRAMPTAWAIALDAAGRIVVALEDGRVCCFAAMN